MKKTILALVAAAATMTSLTANADSDTLNESNLPQAAYSYFEISLGVVDLSEAMQLNVAKDPSISDEVRAALLRSEFTSVRKAISGKHSESAMMMYYTKNSECG